MNNQRIIDRACAVAASWEQWLAASDMDKSAMFVPLAEGMKRLISALDDMDQSALIEMAEINQKSGQDVMQGVRPHVLSILEQDMAEHGELWKELAKK